MLFLITILLVMNFILAYVVRFSTIVRFLIFLNRWLCLKQINNQSISKTIDLITWKCTVFIPLVFIIYSQQLIVQKAAHDLRKQKETETEERKKVINSRVPELNINDLGISTWFKHYIIGTCVCVCVCVCVTAYRDHLRSLAQLVQGHQENMAAAQHYSFSTHS